MRWTFPRANFEDDSVHVGYQGACRSVLARKNCMPCLPSVTRVRCGHPPHNVRRVIRALKCTMMASPLCAAKSQFSVPREHYHALWFGLTRNREILYERINLRASIDV